MLVPAARRRRPLRGVAIVDSLLAALCVREVSPIVLSVSTRPWLKGCCSAFPPINLPSHPLALPPTHPPPQELGAAALSKRPTSCMLVMPKPPKGPVDEAEQKEFEEAYNELAKKIKAAMPSVF